MIRVIYIILVIAIKYLKMHLNNKNLLLKKSIISFELYTEKAKKISTLYYFSYYNSQIMIN